MKASAVGLETTVFLTEEENKQVKNSPIRGILKFREVNKDAKKEIPFILNYNLKQKETIEIELSPEGAYFGDSDEIKFNINNYFYENLEEYKEFADRFFGAGKLSIIISKTLNS